MEGTGFARPAEDIKNSQKKVNDTLSIMYTNADCLTNKRTELYSLLQSLNSKPEIIIITEVNNKSIDNKMQESEYNLDGYNIFGNHIGDKYFRGILIYVDSNLKASQLDICCKFEECIFVQLEELTKSNLLIGAIYRSPNSKIENDQYLLDLVNVINKECKGRFLLAGDFNYSSIDWSNWTTTSSVTGGRENKFLSCLRENLLCQHVLLPTRMRGSCNPHILDLIITNDDNMVDTINYLSPLGKSDHAVLYFECKSNSLDFVNSDKLNYNKGNYVGLRQFVNRNWDNELSDSLLDVNNCWNKIKNIISNGISRFVPKIDNNHWKKKNSWKRPIPANLKKLIKKKNRLWTRFIETQNKSLEKEYKRVRNQVRQQSRKLEQEEQKLVAASCKDNPKKFWKFIRCKTNTRAGIGNIKTVDSNKKAIILTDDIDKCNAFANFFDTIFVKDSVNNNVLLDICNANSNVNESVCDETGIEAKLSALKIDKAPGPDLMHPRILHELGATISGALKILFELSISSGELPDDWKCSTVIVIHKKGSKSDVSNYRPISLTCIACKILESFIRDHLMKYFLDNGLFSCRQYGFIKGRSTVLQLLKLIDVWTSDLESGGQVDVIYTDFEKAFDRVSHRHLLSKLM